METYYKEIVTHGYLAFQASLLKDKQTFTEQQLNAIKKAFDIAAYNICKEAQCYCVKTVIEEYSKSIIKENK